jgi:Uncharacterized protein conserved in bacteria
MAKDKDAVKSFVLRIDAATMEALERWAADEFRSTNGQLQWIIHEALREKRAPEKRQMICLRMQDYGLKRIYRLAFVRNLLIFVL